jgi:hypothetical protein
MTSFTQYSDILLDGFVSNQRSAEVANKKKSILDEILAFYNLSRDNIMFVGFSPWILSMGTTPFVVTEVSDTVVAYLQQQGCVFEHVELFNTVPKSVSVVVAVDEYFTFANSDAEQRRLTDQLSSLAQNLIITTLRDYKNQDFKDREFSQPIMISGMTGNKIYLEYYSYEPYDKNASTSITHVISDQLTTHGPYDRRNMYFKQLAKFSIDAGATNFYVHKNLMYKSVIKKNYEHIITIKF